MIAVGEEAYLILKMFSQALVEHAGFRPSFETDLGPRLSSMLDMPPLDQNHRFAESFWYYHRGNAGTL